MSEKKICFFIAPIGEDGSEERKRSDRVEKFIIEPVTKKFGYEVIRADRIGKSGMITSQIIRHIFESHLVIADLAFHNPNVFYELALRHVVRKPFVQLIPENQKIPFDVAGLRTIHLDHHDLLSADQCKAELEKQIQEIENDPTSVESPVSQANDVQALKGSGKHTEQYIGKLMEMVSELAAQLGALRQQLIPPYQVASTLGVLGSGTTKNIYGMSDETLALIRDSLSGLPAADPNLKVRGFNFPSGRINLTPPKKDK